MEKCKFCQAELEENSTVCPVCGKDNAAEEENVELSAGAEPAVEEEAAAQEAPAEEAPAEEVPAEEVPAEEKKSPVKAALAVISVLAVVALLVALVIGGSKKESPQPVEETSEAVEETVEATIPADGNPDDETCKGTYSADDEAVIAAHDLVIATAGENELTLGQLQVYYWMEVRNFLNNYGAYAAYFGMDIQQPLETQSCGVTDIPMTWQQYFLGAALNSWHTYSAMTAEAQKAGFAMQPEYQQIMDNLVTDLENGAKQNNLGSAEDVLHKSLGNAVTLEDYRAFMERYYHGYGYFSDMQKDYEPTEEMLEAFFQEHKGEYEDAGLTQEDIYVNVRHILVMPQAAEGAEEADEAAWTEAEKKAEEVYKQWKDGEKTEDSFAALAAEHSQDPGSQNNGGLYTDVARGQMVEAFDAWCFDPERQVGDHGIVKTNYGYHIMFFSGSRPVWVERARNDYLQEKTNEVLGAAVAKYPMTVQYSQILLGRVDMNA